MILPFIALAAGFVYGVAAHKYALPPWSTARAAWHALQPESAAAAARDAAPAGRWRPVRTLRADRGARGADTRLAEEMARLEAIGYVAGYEPAVSATGVTVNVPGRACPGLNLYTSGHAPEAVLMDLDGRVRHRWSRGFRDVWPGADTLDTDHDDYWRRVRLLENGDLLAIYEGLGFIRLNRDSDVIWALRGAYHHDLDIADDGSIYVLSREAKILPRINKKKPVLEDFITILTPDGEFVRRMSLLQAFEKSAFAPTLATMVPEGDLFHTNTLEILDGSLADRAPAFKRGNVLVSILKLSTVAIVDMQREEVVWTLSGLWQAQHEPNLLDNGRLMVFDNLGHRGFSKVIEVDPFTQHVAWMYGGDAQNGFVSKVCGLSQRLPNGNTLITETEAGRAFEVTPEKQIVWEFLNPERAGQNGELIAALMELVRVPPSFPLSWLDAAEPATAQR